MNLWLCGKRKESVIREDYFNLLNVRFSERRDGRALRSESIFHTIFLHLLTCMHYLSTMEQQERMWNREKKQEKEDLRFVLKNSGENLDKWLCC